MESGSVLSEPSTGTRGFAAERSVSMTILSSQPGKPRMANLESLEAKMASIEVSLSSSTNTPRRRKGTSLGGGSTISARASPRPSLGGDAINQINTIQKPELRSAMQERETIIQNLRLQLGLGKLPRPTGTPLEESERPVAEQRLLRLRNDADNKRIAIRNLKGALEKLDITDNIDVRIRQAELEYALGREELQLLSLVEEIRALQSRLERSHKSDSAISQNTLFNTIQSGSNLSLHAVEATVGRFGATAKHDALGLYVEWALDGEGLFRGDRIIEVNGKLLGLQTKEEFQKIIGYNGKCGVVVIRKRVAQQPHQLLLQSQEDNQRLQHRISYLEDQVKELQDSTKESVTAPAASSHSDTKANAPSAKHINGSHVTSISISSTPTTTTTMDAEKPQIFQRGNYITTIIGGKPIINSPNNSAQHHITKTLIKEMNGHRSESERDLYYHNNQKNMLQHSQSHQNIGPSNKLLSLASKISINSETSSQINATRRERDRHREYTSKENRLNNKDDIHRHSSNPNLLNGGVSIAKANGNGHFHHSRFSQDRNHNCNLTNSTYEPITESKNYSMSNGKHLDHHRKYEYQSRGHQSTDLRSVKSLDFDKDHKVMNTHKHSSAALEMHRKQREIDYTSEPVASPLSNVSRSRNGMRPTPPKKPLRLSLQRAQSLQTIEASATAAILDLEKKRAIKRTHRGNKTPDLQQYIENNSYSGSHPHLHTSSLGRNKNV